MKRSKISLADLFTLLTALIFGFVCFLSKNFYTLGNITLSINQAIIIIVLLAGSAFGAKLLKSTTRHFKTCFVLEIILISLFTISMFFSCLYFSHYFAVSGQRGEIQRKLITSINQAEKMFNEYEHYTENREALYKNKLRSVAAAKSTNPSEYSGYGFEINEVADEKQIENKIFTLHGDLFPTNYEKTIQVASEWLKNARNKVTHWSWIRYNIGIVSVVNDVEKNSKIWQMTLKELSVIRGKGEQVDDFLYNLTFDDVKKHFTTLGWPTPLSIGLTIIAYLLLLLPYFISDRSSKTKVDKTTRRGNFDIDI